VAIVLLKKKCAHPEEDLAKSGYKPNMKHKILIILVYFWLLTEESSFFSP
jgi:hypothetical protein